VVSFFAGFSAPLRRRTAFSDYLGYFFPSLKQANATVVVARARFRCVWRRQLAACGLIAPSPC